jgi:hypothetical protein
MHNLVGNAAGDVSDRRKSEQASHRDLYRAVDSATVHQAASEHGRECNRPQNPRIDATHLLLPAPAQSMYLIKFATRRGSKTLGGYRHNRSRRFNRIILSSFPVGDSLIHSVFLVSDGDRSRAA